MKTELLGTVLTNEDDQNVEDGNSENSEIDIEPALYESGHESQSATTDSDTGSKYTPDVEGLAFTPAQPSLCAEMCSDRRGEPDNDSDNDLSESDGKFPHSLNETTPNEKEGKGQIHPPISSGSYQLRPRKATDFSLRAMPVALLNDIPAHNKTLQSQDNDH